MDHQSSLLTVIVVFIVCTNEVLADIVTHKITLRDVTSSQVTTKRVNKEFCPEEKLKNGNKTLTWLETPIGVNTLSNEFCVNEKGVPAERYCDSNRKGAFWNDVVGNCSDQYKTTNKTDQLHSLLVGYILNGDIPYGKISSTSEELEHFTYMDQYLLARLFYAMTLEDNPATIVQNFEAVMNNLIELNVTDNSTTAKMFEPHNYTLAAINVFFNRIAEVQYPTHIKSTNFYIQISKPFIDNTTGFAMYRNTEDSFLNYTIRNIHTFESHGDIPDGDLEVAGYVSEDLMDFLKTNLTDKEKENFKVLIGVFQKNKFFKLENKTEASRVISVSISGFCGDRDISLFNIFLKPLINEQDVGEWFVITNNDLYNGDIVVECQFAPIAYMFLYDNHTDDQTCKNVLKYPLAEVNVHNSLPREFEFHKETTLRFDVSSTFSMSVNYAQLQRVDVPQYKKYPFAEVNVHNNLSRGVEFHKEPTDVTRRFNMLSTVSMLVNYAQPQRVVVAQYKKHEFLLYTIMLMGCSLSILGIVGLILTVSMIKNWHQKRWYSIQLVITMASETLLFLISTNLPYIAYIILYYFILSQFAWMMLIGYIQYLKFVKIFDENFLSNWQSLIIGWMIPLVVVLIPICIYPHCLYCASCTENRTIIIYFVILPTSLVILGNIIIYVLIMVNISRSKSKEFGVNISKKQTRIGLLLPFLLGITWVFVFALVSPWSIFALIGSYLLHLIAPIQAFVLFIFIVVLDADTRHKWKAMYFVCKRNKVKPKNIATTTTGAGQENRIC